MIYHFLLLCEESESFILEIQMHGENTFLDFHHAIQTAMQFDDNYLASFWRTDDQWSKLSEVTLIDMERDGHLLMEDLSIEDWCRPKGHELLYIFDYFIDCSLFVKVMEGICSDDDLSVFPKVIKIEGKRPLQLRTGEKYIDDLLDGFSAN